MSNDSISLNKLMTTVGIMSAIGLIAYFLLMQAVGLLQVTELRYLNGVILLAGLLYGLNKYNKESGGLSLNYLEGLKLGLGITVISVVAFVVFLFIYLNYINPSFMAYLQNNVPLGEHMTPATAAGAVFMEGAASGAVFTFICMQYYKRVEKSGTSVSS